MFLILGLSSEYKFTTRMKKNMRAVLSVATQFNREAEEQREFRLPR